MEWQMWIIETLRRALAYGTPLLLGTLGEIYAERSGVLNLGVEGMMILGALVGFITTFVTGSLWLGFLMGALVGGAASLIHAFLSVTLKVVQVVSGLALTLFGLGITGVMGRGWEGQPLKISLPQFSIQYLEEIPILGPIVFVEQNILVYIVPWEKILQQRMLWESTLHLSGISVFYWAVYLLVWAEPTSRLFIALHGPRV
jgi:simple sugar transport system permease protein